MLKGKRFNTRLCCDALIFEFSDNYNKENIENPENVKSIAETFCKMCLMINTQGFHDKEFLQIFYRFLHFACKLKP